MFAPWGLYTGLTIDLHAKIAVDPNQNFACIIHAQVQFSVEEINIDNKDATPACL